MNTNTQTTRSNYLDNLKGVLIFLVVLGHFLFDYQGSQAIKAIVQIIYLFHMPAFVFISGYLSKSENSRKLESLLKLFALYYVFNGMFLMLNIIRGGEVSIVKPYLSCWYLIAMIAWRLTIASVSKFKYSMQLSVVLAFAVGFLPFIGNVFAISRIIAFYPFFLCGYKLNQEDLNFFTEIKNSKKREVGIILLAGVVLSGLVAFKLLNLTDANLTMEAYDGAEEFFVRIVMFMISVAAILMLLVIVSDKKLPLLTMAGRNSLSIYLIHRFFPLIYVKIISTTSSSIIVILTSLICTFAIILFFGLDAVNTLINRLATAGVGLVYKTKTKLTSEDAVIQLGYLAFTVIMILAFAVYTLKK